jgi:hypothetical protein
MDLEITCINKQPRENTHEAITHLGGPFGGGWRWTRPQVVTAIETKEHSYFTLVNGKRADVSVRVSSSGNKYVQTHADGYWNNNLLALPEC